MARTAGLSVPLLFSLVLAVVAAAFLFLMSHQATEAGADNKFEISPAPKYIGVASSGSVKLVAEPGADSLVIWTIEIAYDPEVVTFNSCTPGPSPAGALALGHCEAKDAGGSPDDDTVVSIGFALFPDTERGLEDETTLATVKFDAVGAVDECSALTISVIANLGPDPETPEGSPVVTNGEICIVEDAGVDRTWGDVDCKGDAPNEVATRDSQAILRNVLEQNPLSQADGCPDIGQTVTVDGVERTWGDVDCKGDAPNEVATRDSQAILRNVLEQNPLSQGDSCPAIGDLVQVSD